MKQNYKNTLKENQCNVQKRRVSASGGQVGDRPLHFLKVECPVAYPANREGRSRGPEVETAAHRLARRGDVKHTSLIAVLTSVSPMSSAVRRSTAQFLTAGAQRDTRQGRAYELRRCRHYSM